MTAVSRRDAVTFDRARLILLLSWMSSHPSVSDLDEVSTLALDGLRSCLRSDPNAIAAGEREAVERVAFILDVLLGTVGNCETEERNLKSRLWLDAGASAEMAHSLLGTNR